MPAAVLARTSGIIRTMEKELGVFEKFRELTESPKAQEIQPKYLVVSSEGELFLPVKDTADLLGLSTSRVLALISEDRLAAVKLTGWENYVSVESAIDYVEAGRKLAGRPRKRNP